MRSPGRKPSRSPASTAGRVRMMRETSRSSSAATASAMARYVLPVPAGPMPKVTVERADGVDVALLVDRLRRDPLAAPAPDDVVQDVDRAPVLRHHAADGVDGLRRERHALLDELAELAQHGARPLDVGLLAVQRQLVAAQVDAGAEAVGQVRSTSSPRDESSRASSSETVRVSRGTRIQCSDGHGGPAPRPRQGSSSRSTVSSSPSTMPSSTATSASRRPGRTGGRRRGCSSSIAARAAPRRRGTGAPSSSTSRRCRRRRRGPRWGSRRPPARRGSRGRPSARGGGARRRPPRRARRPAARAPRPGCVGAQGRPLTSSQRLGVQQDAVGQRRLADVVQPAAEPAAVDAWSATGRGGRAVAVASSATSSAWRSGMLSRSAACRASARARRMASGSSATRSSTVRSLISTTRSRPRRLAA